MPPRRMGIPALLIGLFISSLLCMTGYTYMHYDDSAPSCPTAKLRSAMETAVKFRREGDMSLDIYLKEALKNEFTSDELEMFNKLADAAERRKIVDSFKKDTFQFMDKDGISHTFPDGYIKR